MVFGTNSRGLLRVSAGGGAPVTLTTLNTEQGEISHRWPSVIPDGNAVVFVVETTDGRHLAVHDLGTGDMSPLGLAGTSPRYISTGHLVYVAEDESLRAVGFTPAELEVTGTPVPLAESVMVSPDGGADFSLSNDGRLVYVPRTAGGGAKRSLVWVDRMGEEEPIAAPPRAYTYPRISPDGTRVALDVRDQEHDIWILDLARDDALTRLTFAAQTDQYGQWTADGQHVVFSSQRLGAYDIFTKAADGTGEVKRLLAEVATVRYGPGLPGDRLPAGGAI